MFVHIEGVEDKVSKALDYLNQIGVRLVFPKKNLIWQEAKCTHCGSCVGQCFPDALHINNETGLLLFKHELCVACGLCIPACPFGALESVDQHVATSQK
jgi:ferredoxin